MLEKYNIEHKKKKIYLKWQKNNCFSPNYKLNKKYCIVIPPPNITGNLHMGHAYQCTLIDILVRYKRMTNHCVLWKMGTDHAGIATQMLIEKNFKENNINNTQKKKYKILYENANKWKKQSILNINTQLKELGCSLNWKTQRFTLDKNFIKSVNTAFITLYEEKLIYKSNKIVNWDPILKTAISDLETIYKKEKTKLYYIKYKALNNKKTYLTIATTRPETIFGDVCLAVNPKDKRYTHLINEKFIIPIINKTIPIIKEETIDINYGTGCMKITPAHDHKDFELAEKHKLKKINILTKEARLNVNVPKKYRNLTIIEARETIIDDLKRLNLIEKIEEQEHNIPRGDRSNCIIEPLITEQWYVKIKPLIEPVKLAIEKNDIKIYPNKWKKVFLSWINNMKDWCISRQIWWGHKIPIWYDSNNNIYVEETANKVRKKYNLNKNTKIKRDRNVLDTWFSSALWPFASLGWPKNTKEYINFYPNDILITGFDIIFFWAIRMMMFGIKFTKKVPFKEIYIHGLIRDNQGNKMSKTKGNVLDPLDIINGISYENLIKKRTHNLLQSHIKDKIVEDTKKYFPNGIEPYGTDALRFALCSSATKNISIKLDLEKVKAYKNFCNKLWNAGIFIKINCKKIKKNYNKKESIFDKWIVSTWETNKEKFIKNINKKNFKSISEILYKFIWQEYCNSYIEISKLLITNNLYTHNTKNTLINILKEILKTIHPIIPYTSEAIWENIHNNNKQKLLTLSDLPKLNKSLINKKYEKSVNLFKNISSIIRKSNIKNIKINEQKNIYIKNISIHQIKHLEKIKPFIIKTFNLNQIKINTENINTQNLYIQSINNIKILIEKENINDYIKKENIKTKIKTIDEEIKKIKTTLNNIDFIKNADKKIIIHKKEKLKNLIEKKIYYEDS